MVLHPESFDWSGLSDEFPYKTAVRVKDMWSMQERGERLYQEQKKQEQQETERGATKINKKPKKQQNRLL